MRSRRMACLGLLATAAVLSFHPGPASAQNDITLTTLSVAPREHASSFYLRYTGDANANAAAHVSYWKVSEGSARADSGVVPVRNDGFGFFTGTLFWLQPGVQYRVQLRILDPDNASSPLVMTSDFTTRKYENRFPNGQIWVDPVNGNDNNNGSTAPVRTIAKAMTLVAQGGQIRLQPGVYHERQVTTTRDGTASTPCSIVGNGDPGSVILDGSDMDGGVEVGGDPAWQQGGASPYQYYTTALPTASQSAKLVVLGDSVRMHRKLRLEQLLNPAAFAGAVGDTCFYYPAQGFAIDGSTLYVRPENPASAPGSFHIASGNFGLLVINHDYWRVDSLTFRFSGEGGVWLRQYYVPDAHAREIAIRNCRFQDNGSSDIYGELDVHDVLVENCTFLDSRVDRWNYCAGKKWYAERRNAIVFNGNGWIIRNNVVDGHFDGIKCFGSDTSLTRGTDSDIYLNTIDHINDDAIELDETNGFNLCVWRNTIRHSGSGISHAPLYAGPAYFVYNLFLDGDRLAANWENSSPFSYGVKWGGDSAATGKPNDGVAIYVHNTFKSQYILYPIYNVTGNGAADHLSHKILRNNIFVGTSAPAVQQPYDSYAYDYPANLPLDYDLYWKSPSGGTLAWWGSQVTTLAALSQLHGNWGLEQHGVTGSPVFRNPSAGDYHLEGISPGFDAGTQFRGINTAFHMNGDVFMYECQPEMGAFESGCLGGDPGGGDGDPDPILPAVKRGDAPLEFALRADGPNPSAGVSQLVLALPSDQVVSIAVFDAAGRVVATLAGSQKWRAGLHSVRWNGASASGRTVPPGVYFIRARTPLGTRSRAVVRTE